ncbi:SDR family oxidoreductase [Euzebya tangerina]|uniref:SDR family oxidoreductase n=1 Tax=Euzebya tangerina TaxID=591198 RepID=UPI000E3219D3|nr:NAD(P)H-binding protein [Euzebya tangerina]
MTHTPHQILITGATGKTGRRVLRRLRSGYPDHAVRGVSRSTTPRFDWTDRDTWDAVLSDIDVVYLCYSPDLGFPGAAGTVGAFATRAVERGVSRAVLLSGRGEPEARAAEEAVRNTGIGLTVLRAAWLAQNFTEDFLAGAIAEGVVALPIRTDVGEPVVDADDVADAIVRSLTDDRLTGQTHELTGPNLWTLEEMVQRIATATGRSLQAVQVPMDTWVAGAVEAGMPASLARQYAELFAAIMDGRNAQLAPGLVEVLGRDGGDFGDFVRSAAAADAWTVAA